jgi:ABC-type Fe2+-enterobactin transport system substrate-binding protein
MAAPSRRIVVKTSHRASILVLAITALAGCAGMQDKSAMNPNQIVDDSAYIAQVEHLARERGVSVHWVNPPQKRVKDLQQDQ